MLMLLGCLGAARPAAAHETTTYSYDVLGRLVATSITGGPNNEKNAVACFDAAGNRSRYITATGAVASCSQTASSSSTEPLVANPEASPPLAKCGGASVNVVANGADPEVDLPLVVPSATSRTALTGEVFGATAPGTVSVTVTDVNLCA